MKIKAAGPYLPNYKASHTRRLQRKAIPVHAMKAHDKVTVQLNVFITSALEGWVVSFTPGCFISSTHQTEGWVDSTASRDILKNRKPITPATNLTLIPQLSSL